MKIPKRKLLYHIVNILTIALIVECFLCAMLLVQKQARSNCFDRIEESTTEISNMFAHSMNEQQEKLTVFADILAARFPNPDELIQTHMENFCKTQFYTALCIHRADGSTISYGSHPHDPKRSEQFAAEAAALPYVSELFSYGGKPEENYIFQAVPIMKDGETIAILYGYLSLDSLPKFIASSAYDGKCQLYVVDGDTGNLLMDEHHNELGNIYDGRTDQWEPQSGYDLNALIKSVKNGESGFFVCRSRQGGLWYYTYYMPLGINNWSMQLTIDEPTAFAAYNTIHRAMLMLMFGVLALLIILIISLMAENKRVNKRDMERLHKSNFINTVQQSLLNVYMNADAINTALKTVADEAQAETVLLLSFNNNVVSDARYWPSIDRPQALEMVGSNVHEVFPAFFDQLAAGKSVLYEKANSPWELSGDVVEQFDRMDVRRLIMVPILDTVFKLRGVIVAVNSPASMTAEPLESVVYDFFMAITNLESQNIIKRMGAYDYLTGLKNRNSFEIETPAFATQPGKTLWCLYVDVNGLHELNNQKGHKAGDLMLCAVANTIRNIYGSGHTYRIGGDEFVVFRFDSSLDEMTLLKEKLLTRLAKMGYSISSGFACTEKNVHDEFDVDQVIARADEIMCQIKQQYYEEHPDSADRSYQRASV